MIQFLCSLIDRHSDQRMESLPLGGRTLWGLHGVAVWPSSEPAGPTPQHRLGQHHRCSGQCGLRALAGVFCLGDGFVCWPHHCLGQRLRCLHPPAGAVALLGVLLNAKPLFVLTPVFIGSLFLTGMAVAFNRLHALPERYPHHWL